MFVNSRSVATALTLFLHVVNFCGALQPLPFLCQDNNHPVALLLPNGTIISLPRGNSLSSTANALKHRNPFKRVEESNARCISQKHGEFKYLSSKESLDSERASQYEGCVQHNVSWRESCALSKTVFEHIRGNSSQRVLPDCKLSNGTYKFVRDQCITSHSPELAVNLNRQNSAKIRGEPNAYNSHCLRYAPSQQRFQCQSMGPDSDCTSSCNHWGYNGELETRYQDQRGPGHVARRSRSGAQTGHQRFDDASEAASHTSAYVCATERIKPNYEHLDCTSSIYADSSPSSSDQGPSLSENQRFSRPNVVARKEMGQPPKVTKTPNRPQSVKPRQTEEPRSRWTGRHENAPSPAFDFPDTTKCCPRRTANFDDKLLRNRIFTPRQVNRSLNLPSPFHQRQVQPIQYAMPLGNVQHIFQAGSASLPVNSPGQLITSQTMPPHRTSTTPHCSSVLPICLPSSGNNQGGKITFSNIPIPTNLQLYPDLSLSVSLKCDANNVWWMDFHVNE